MDKFINTDCLIGMKNMDNNSVDFTLTDIPYNAINRASGGLRNLDKGFADVATFDLNQFLPELLRVTKGSIVVFCEFRQFSEIFGFFAQQKGTTRAIVWEKSNPSPMNGKLIYLSGIEMAVWFKPKGHKTFNAHCKNTVFKHPTGRSKLHPTEKNHSLLKEIILDNSSEGDVVFDPCAGSASHLLVAKQNNRGFKGFEINTDMFYLAKERLYATEG